MKFQVLGDDINGEPQCLGEWNSFSDLLALQASIVSNKILGLEFMSLKNVLILRVEIEGRLRIGD